jgi:hypothetical protein
MSQIINSFSLTHYTKTKINAELSSIRIVRRNVDQDVRKWIYQRRNNDWLIQAFYSSYKFEYKFFVKVKIVIDESTR